MMKNNKKGVSGIVTTVLLILVGITAVALIVAFLIPFIRGNLDESRECFNVLGKAEVVVGANTCYDAADESVRVRISRTYSDEVGVQGFAVVLGNEGRSKRYDVVGGTNSSLIKELGGNYSDTLALPREGEQRTHVFDVSSDFSGEAVSAVELSPVLEDGGICTGATPVTLPEC